MSEPDQRGTTALPEPVVPERPARGDGVDLRAAAVIVLVLAAVGALAGLLWAAWSPPGPRALVVRPGVFIPDETEAFVAGDGRFLLITAVLGVLAGLAVWFVRPARTAATAVALAVGGTAGTVLTALVGHATGGGSGAGKPNTIVAQLPLSVHAQGLYVVEPALAVLVFGLLVAFAVHDDLGRPDPVRDRIWAARPRPEPSADSARPGDLVEPGADAQDGRGDGDAAGVLEQGDLPAQQPTEPHQPR